MNIGELFVNLGIKGADKTIGALGSVKKGLGDIGSMSIEAKAGILGMMYGLERMMAISGAAGTGLTNFTAFTGKSAQDLQKWQYAARQAGVGAEELTGSVKTVQNAMSNMLMGNGHPEYIALVSKALMKATGKGLDPSQYNDTFYVMKSLQTAMQTMTTEQGNLAGKSFGLTDGMMAAMRRNAFNPAAFAKAPTYSDKEIGSLDKSNIAWSNLSNKIEMGFGHINAKHGQQLVNDISKLVTETMKFIDLLIILSEKFKVFELIGTVFEGITKAMRLMNGETAESIQKGQGKKRSFGEGTHWMNGIEWLEDKYLEMSQHTHASKGGDIGTMLGAGMMGVMPPASVTNTTTVNQNITHHGDAKDTKSVKDAHRQGAQAYRQSPAVRQAH